MATTEGGQASTSPGGGAATFADFLRRVCAGEEAAATELVQRYEPALRLEVQLRLTDPKLRRLLEPLTSNPEPWSPPSRGFRHWPGPCGISALFCTLVTFDS
jgi:hypothetical protein